MKLETTARIDLVKGPVPEARFLVQARLPNEEGHPYGQWSLAVQPKWLIGDSSLFAEIDFVAADAPREQLLAGTELELFRGPNRVGRATVVIAAPGTNRDRDFLSALDEPPREEAAA